MSEIRPGDRVVLRGTVTGIYDRDSCHPDVVVMAEDGDSWVTLPPTMLKRRRWWSRNRRWLASRPPAPGYAERVALHREGLL